MNGTSSQACEEETLTLLGNPKHNYVERAEVVDPSDRDGRRLVCESFYWEVSHDGLKSCSTEYSASNAFRFD